MSSFRFSISVSRETKASCCATRFWCWERISAFSAAGSRAFRSGSVGGAAAIAQLCHNSQTITTVFVSYCHLGHRCAYRTPPVDALQQHGQLRACERHLPVFCLRPNESAPLQALGKQAQPVAVPPQDLDQVATPAPKYEHVPAKRVLFQLHLN